MSGVTRVILLFNRIQINSEKKKWATRFLLSCAVLVALTTGNFEEIVQAIYINWVREQRERKWTDCSSSLVLPPWQFSLAVGNKGRGLRKFPLVSMGSYGHGVKIYILINKGTNQQLTKKNTVQQYSSLHKVH